MPGKLPFSAPTRRLLVAGLPALAIAKAGTTEGPKIREAFYGIDKYDGLIKSYAKPFSPENHDALSSDDYIFTYFKEGEILPLMN